MSTVVLATCARSGAAVAVKVYHRDRMNGMNVRQVAREIEIHASLLHPHVVKLYAAFEDAEAIYLVQEYAARGASLVSSLSSLSSLSHLSALCGMYRHSSSTALLSSGGCEVGKKEGAPSGVCASPFLPPAPAAPAAAPLQATCTWRSPGGAATCRRRTWSRQCSSPSSQPSPTSMPRSAPLHPAPRTLGASIHALRLTQ